MKENTIDIGGKLEKMSCHDLEVLGEIFPQLDKVFRKIEGIKRRVYSFPRRDIFYAFIIEQVSHGKFNDVRKMIKELEKKVNCFDNEIEAVEVQFQEFLVKNVIA